MELPNLNIDAENSNVETNVHILSEIVDKVFSDVVLPKLENRHLPLAHTLSEAELRIPGKQNFEHRLRSRMQSDEWEYLTGDEFVLLITKQLAQLIEKIDDIEIIADEKQIDEIAQSLVVYTKDGHKFVLPLNAGDAYKAKDTSRLLGSDLYSYIFNERPTFPVPGVSTKALSIVAVCFKTVFEEYI